MKGIAIRLECDAMRNTDAVEDTRNGAMSEGDKALKELMINLNHKIKLKEILLDGTREFFKRESQVINLRIDLKKLIESSPPDKAKIDSKIDEIADAGTQMEKIKIHVIRMRKACSRSN